MMRKPLSRQSNAGFTLIEMIVVMVMIGVLFAIAAPGWLALSNRQRANSARDQVFQALRLAQADAMRTHRAQTLEINTTPDPPTLLVKPTGTTGGTPQNIGNGQAGERSIGLQPTGSPTSIYFDEQGNLDQASNSVIPTEAAPIKIVISVPPNSSSTKTCVLIQTLLGAARTESGSACN